MLEFFDRLLFNALVEYNTMYNRCIDDPVFASAAFASGIGQVMENYMCLIVNSAEDAGAISFDDWRIVRHTIGMIGLGDEALDYDYYVPLRYEVEA